MKLFEIPEIEVIKFTAEESIMASGTGCERDCPEDSVTDWG